MRGSWIHSQEFFNGFFLLSTFILLALRIEHRLYFCSSPDHNLHTELDLGLKMKSIGRVLWSPVLVQNVVKLAIFNVTCFHLW